MKSETVQIPEHCVFNYAQDTYEASTRLGSGTIDQASQVLGMKNAEPLIVMLDCFLKYALNYKWRYGGNLSTDGVLGQYWLDGIRAVHGLLNGDGVIAMKRNITTDSKSNGACESVYWAALTAAGYTEKDL